MPRTVTVTFKDGTQHTYQNVPDDVTPDAINTRASSEFSQPVLNIDGGKTVDPVTVTAAKKPATFLGTAGRALYNLPRDAWDTVTGVVGGAAHAVMHPFETVHAAHGAIDQAAAILGG